MFGVAVAYDEDAAVRAAGTPTERLLETIHVHNPHVLPTLLHTEPVVSREEEEELEELADQEIVSGELPEARLRVKIFYISHGQ
jgi:hypothetical protein